MLCTAFTAILLKDPVTHQQKLFPIYAGQKSREGKVPVAQEGLIMGRETAQSGP